MSADLNKITHLFVYGTLAPGERNAHIMNGMKGNWQTATVHGQRFDTGWGVHNGAPGFYPDPTGHEVTGLVFSSNDLPAHWARLDAFEGADYCRVLIDAKLDSGEHLDVCVYRAIRKP